MLNAFMRCIMVRGVSSRAGASTQCAATESSVGATDHGSPKLKPRGVERRPCWCRCHRTRTHPEVVRPILALLLDGSPVARRQKQPRSQKG